MFYYLGLVLFIALSVGGFYWAVTTSTSWEVAGGMTGIVGVIGAIVFLVFSVLYVVGDRGEGIRTGVIVKVSNSGIIWKTKQFKLVTANADGTFASTGEGAEKSFSIIDDADWVEVKTAFENKKVVRVRYRIKFENPWVAESEQIVTGIDF